MSFGANAETARVVDMLEDLGEAIKIKREATGLSQLDVSKITGVLSSTICRTEQGGFDPRLSSVLPLLRWLFDAPSGKGES